MPLSEDEQRILTEIEQQLSASDPDLVRQVGSTTLYSEALRGVRWGALGVIVGLAAAIVLLSVHFLLAFFIGFGLMFVSAWYLERNLRRLGRTGFQRASNAFQSSSWRDYFNNASERARERFRRDEDD